MIINRRPLIDKLSDEDFLESLNIKSKKQILFCRDYLTEEELNKINSISTGYYIARERYIENVLRELNPDMYKRIKDGETIPIFNIFSDIKENHNL